MTDNPLGYEQQTFPCYRISQSAKNQRIKKTVREGDCVTMNHEYKNGYENEYDNERFFRQYAKCHAAGTACAQPENGIS
ncbi:hypothetical protein C823_002793 [Eubacterium plexicaudatum ASF492]|uniref:Uncharacterized protein n=1 Tax=Eubacterium plexicaudatum ASF492 TaxID=1235802 RepID=N2A966_9FIRM|nr:hypothetical protein C823_002793 [Eubacterium plexicaudatum ASF492]